MEQLEVVSLILFRGFDADDRALLCWKLAGPRVCPRLFPLSKTVASVRTPARPPHCTVLGPATSSFVYGIQVNQQLMMEEETK